MTVRTCLLVSDDPDDHVEFTEALYEIASDIVVLVVSDTGRAAELILSGRHVPDILIVDLAVNGFNHDDFFSSLAKDAGFASLTILAYGDAGEFEKIKSPRISAFMERDSAYSEIRGFLRKVLDGNR